MGTTLTNHRLIPIKKPRRRFCRAVRYSVLTFLLAVSLAWLEGLLIKLPADPLGKTAMGERVGVIHVHTRASDGSGTLPEVISAAREANLSYLAVTDHNVAMDRSAAAYDQPGFALIPGEEVSTNSGHFLALGVSGSWSQTPRHDARALLAASHRAGGANFVAHPFGTKQRWTDWVTSDFDGLEIWNDDAVWRLNNPLDLAIFAILYPVNPQLAMVRLARTPEQNLAEWDELLAQRPIAGICGADAHAAVHVRHRIFARFPSYLLLFRLAREHILLGPQPADEDPNLATSDMLLEALKKGQAFCALDGLYPAGGFAEHISSGGIEGGPGDTVVWSNHAHLQVAVPSGSSLPLIKVFRDGREFVEKQGWTFDTPIPGPGRYRTEVYLRQPGFTGWRRWTLWIFANPIYVSATPVGSCPH